MKLNTNSNAYIIIYSTILVIIVAFLLAFVSSSLRDRQEANVKLDQEKQVLNSLNLRDKGDEEAHALYEKIVKFDEARNLYECTLENGEMKYVFPMKGMGLWGGISGFVALDADMNTVYGAYFNHESETAGLGAEIKDSQAWQEKFIGKKVFDPEGNVALSVVKNVERPEYQVDCVTGATLTSNGVSDMLQKSFSQYAQSVKDELWKIIEEDRRQPNAEGEYNE
ncbi:MAG: FMN-binding protein [Prevotella sp.]|nr:FMN-binding protein [Prevotella sp.]